MSQQQTGGPSERSEEALHAELRARGWSVATSETSEEWVTLQLHPDDAPADRVAVAPGRKAFPVTGRTLHEALARAVDQISRQGSVEEE